MPITRTPIIDDDGTGRTGTPVDNAWKQEFYNQIDAADAAAVAGVGAAWITRPYLAGNYYGVAPLVWAPTAAQIIADRYCVFGKTCLWTFITSGAPATGAPSGAVSVKMPGGVTAKVGLTTICYGLTNGVWGPQALRNIGDHVDLARMDYANIQLAANLYFEFFLTFEIY